MTHLHRELNTAASAYPPASLRLTERQQTSAAGPALRLRRLVLGPLSRRLNPSISRRAGRPGVATFGLIQHRGRRSGRDYATPVATRPIADGFLVPLTFGSEADWCRNVLAAGTCVIRWNGATYSMVDPEIVDAASVALEVRSAFGLFDRTFLRLMGIRQFLRLRLHHSHHQLRP